MTDYKLVPVEPTEAMIRAMEAAAWDDSNSMPAIRAMAQAYRAMLSAAPEPVSDTFKLDRQSVIDAVKTAMNDAWCDITSDTGCWPSDLHRLSVRGPVRIEYRPAIWTDTTAEMVANTITAAPVVGEPVAWRYRESYSKRWTVTEEKKWGDYAAADGGACEPLYTHPDPKFSVAVKALKGLVAELESGKISIPRMKRNASEALAQIKDGA